MSAPPPSHPPAAALRAFALGKLPPSSADTISRHVETCGDCMKVVAESSADGSVRRPRPAHERDAGPTPTGDASRGGRSSVDPAGQPPAGPLPAELANSPEYEVLRELGRGGMGVVYLARNRLMERLEVLKVVGRAGAAGRFLKEIQAAARLSHPNVVSAYAARPFGDLLVFAMEYVDGENLADVVKARGPLAVAKACYYAQQAAAGLQHAFEKGMAHRDVKPANLILARDGKKHVVKVLDFGLAKVVSDQPVDGGLTAEGRMLGTPDYIAPEQILNAQAADIRADIYSLGGTLYYLLTGDPPFRATSLFELLQHHQVTTPTPLNLIRPDVPTGLAGVVGRMMAKDPARRYQTPAEVSRALDPFVRAGPTSGTRLDPPSARSTVVAQPVTTVVVPPPVAVPPVVPQPIVPPPAAPIPDWVTQTTPGGGVWDAITDETPAAEGAAGRGGRWQVPAVGVLAVLLALGVAWGGGAFRSKPKTGAIVVENAPVDAEVEVDGTTANVSRDGDEWTVPAVPEGPHQVRVVRGPTVLHTSDVTVKAGGPVRVRLDRPVPKPKAKPAAKTAEGPAPGEGTPLDSPDLPASVAPVAPPPVVDPAPAVAAVPAPPAVVTPAPAPPPDPAPDFGRVVGLGPAVVEGGDWRVVNGELVQTAAGKNGVILFGDPTWTDYDFTAEVRAEKSTSAQIVHRAKSADQFTTTLLRNRLDDNGKGMLTIESYDPSDGKGVYPGNRDGLRHEVYNRPVEPLDVTRWHTYKISVRGEKTTVTFDGGAPHAFLSLRHKAGRVGFRAVGGVALYRNPKVTAPDGTVLWEGMPDVPPPAPVTVAPAAAAVPPAARPPGDGASWKKVYAVVKSFNAAAFIRNMSTPGTAEYVLNIGNRSRGVAAAEAVEQLRTVLADPKSTDADCERAFTASLAALEPPLKPFGEGGIRSDNLAYKTLLAIRDGIVQARGTNKR